VTAYPLRQLEAEFHKVVKITSTEIEQDDDPKIKGLYVFRGSDGYAHSWSDKPFTYQFHDVQTLAEADGIMFLCPLCFQKNGGAAGTHCVMVTFAGRNVPDEAGSRGNDGKPTRWTAAGTSMDDLVLTPSIALNQNGTADDGLCHWHGFVGSSGIAPGHAG
jgi:hypothetical protein